MRFVNKLSYACANRLTYAMNENHQKRAVYYFGFQIVIGEVVKNIIMLSVALLLGILIPVLIISLCFASLRYVAGGYHMDTYGKCLFVSMTLFVIAALISKYTYQYWNIGYITALISILFISGLYTLIRYAPKDTPNKPITDPGEIRKFKIMSIVLLSIYMALIISLTYFNLNFYVLPLCFGLLLELFAVTPTGHKLFDMIKYGLKGFDRKVPEK